METETVAPPVAGFDATYEAEWLNIPEGVEVPHIRVPVTWNTTAAKPTGVCDIIGHVTGPDGFTATASVNYSSEWEEGRFNALIMANAPGFYVIEWQLTAADGSRQHIRSDEVLLVGDEDDAEMLERGDAE